MSPTLEALEYLRPYDTDLTKVRLGPNTDGGYILLEEPLQTATILSYGIATEYRFDEQMANRGHTVFMFDHTIEGIASDHPNLRFVKEGIAGIDDPNASLYRLDSHLSRNKIAGSDLILKMDVEGCEYEALTSVDDAVLARFQQICIEVHDLHLLDDAEFRARYIKMMSKLVRSFTIFHVHANNCDGQNALKLIDGLPVSNLLELSLVRSDLVRRSPSKTLYPTELDFPNTDQKDKYLWFYPFIPVSSVPEAFHACFDRNEKLGDQFFARYLARVAAGEVK